MCHSYSKVKGAEAGMVDGHVVHRVHSPIQELQLTMAFLLSNLKNSVVAMHRYCKRWKLSLDTDIVTGYKIILSLKIIYCLQC